MTDSPDASPLSQTALLVIDIQDSFRMTPRWERRNNPEFEAKVDRLIAGFRRARLPIFYFLHSDGDLHFETTSPHYKLMDFLAPRSDEPVLHKTTRNCFTSTDLQARLVARGIRRLAIAGISMEQCCETTTRVAADLGYDVDFVQDATLTFPIQHVVDGRVVDELPVAEVERRTLFALRGRFARIASVDKLVQELPCASSFSYCSGPR
jgi:nicotinamidase-related amidase